MGVRVTRGRVSRRGAPFAPAAASSTSRAVARPLISCASRVFFFFSSRRRHTRYWRDWSSDVCSSDLVFDDSTDMVYQIMRLARFYAHESSAQCTQCREGTAWTTKILERILSGQGKTEIGRASCRERV